MPPVVLERPKMSRAMWEALKSHILRERQRKKQELEADAEVERQRKERERQLKQDSMTLSETRDQILALDSRLTSLKEEKHQLFMQLKKVLNEDETRRRQLISKEARYEREMMPVHSYMPHPGLPMGSGPPQMMFQQVLARPAMYTVPRVAHAPQHGQPSLLAPRFEGSMKRSRTPSPPPQSHNYKFGPFKPPPQAIHPYPHRARLWAEPSMPLQYYHTPVSQSPQPPQQQSHHVSVSYSGGPHPQSQQPPPPTMYSYAGAPPSRSPQSIREEQQKHVPTGLYLHPGTGIPRGYVVHQPIEHPSQSQKFADDNQKYFPPPSHGLVRGPAHLLHPGLSIQPPQGASSGGITSGYPIRTTPTSQYQGRPPSPHVNYAGQPGQARLSYSHPQHGMPSVSPHGQQQQQQQQQHPHPQQVTISRYTQGISRD